MKSLYRSAVAVVSLLGFIPLPLAQAALPRPAADDPALRPADYQPSGEYYDWRKTGKPERPWLHKYDQTLVMKMFLAERTDEGRGCKVYLTAVLPVELRAGVGNGLCQAAD